MEINQDKTQIVHYRKRHKKEKIKIYQKWHAEIVNTSKYLRVYLDQHLDFTNTGETLAGAAGRAPGKGMRNFRISGMLVL